MTTSINQPEMGAPATLPLNNDDDSQPQYHVDVELRRLVTWGGVLSIAILTAVIFGYIGYLAVHGGQEPTNWIVVILKVHYAAVVGTPMCAFLAFFIVSILKVTSGPIELEAMGVKFQGASGPIVLWMLSFLSVVFAFHMLWASL